MKPEILSAPFKVGSPEYYEAYRNAIIRVESVSFPYPGTTTFTPIDEGLANLIANRAYDVQSLNQNAEGVYSIQTRSGWAGIVGAVDGKPALFHKRQDGTRELQLLTITL